MQKDMKYETPEIKIIECGRKDILTVSPGNILEDDKTWGEIS